MKGLIVFAVPDFEPTIGGTSRQTGNLARAFEQRGFEVAVVTQRLEAHLPREESRGGITVHRLGPSARGWVGMKLFVLHTAWWLRRRRRTIAVVQVVMYPDLVVSARLAGLAARAVMCWAGLGDATDTLAPDRRRAKDVVRASRRLALRKVAHVALTPAIAEELEAVGVTERVTVIPVPIDLEIFRPPTDLEREQARARFGADNAAFVVVYCGHMRALKRVELLVRAFGQLIEEGVDGMLLLVGPSRVDLDDATDAIHQEVERLGLASRVTMTGGTADVVPYLHAADVFALPSDREGLSNGLVEALACGVPCVAPPSAGGDQILDASCGVVPPSNEPGDLAAALRVVAEAPRVALRQGAIRRAEHCDQYRVADQYLAWYGPLLDP